jgi:Transmembrane protein 43
MYQWKEEKKEDTQNNVGGGTTTTTTYDYDPINSSEFKHPENHDNPEMPFRNAQFTASDAKLGGWPLDAEVLGRVTLTQALTPDGTGVMFLGFAIFLAPLSTVASVIPILGDLVGGATALVSLAIAAPLSILVIAFAWLTFRPLIGGSLILVALVVGYLLWRWRKSRAAAMPSATPAKAGRSTRA